MDVVTLYLLPSVNLELRPILQKGLKPGARIVSHDFDMGDWKENHKESVSRGSRAHDLLVDGQGEVNAKNAEFSKARHRQETCLLITARLMSQACLMCRPGRGVRV